MQDRPKLGEILVAAGIIDEMQLSAALGEQSRWGRRLGVTLIKLGMVEEGHLIRALAKQLDLPVASLAGKRIPDDVIALVPAQMASEHCVIPLFTRPDGPKGQLFLGMEDPSNLALLDDLSFRTGMEIRPVMVGPSELGEAIDRYYHGRAAVTPQADPFKNQDTMNVGSLRVVTDDSPQPGTAPADPPPQADAQAPATPDPETTQPVQEPFPIELRDAVPTPTPASAPGVPALPDGVVEDLARALEETERTRVVAKAIAQLLVEKGVLSLDELQSTIAELKTAVDEPDPDASNAAD